MNKQHFADDYLQGIGAKYPSAWKQVNEFRQGRGKDLPSWPDWCFMPMAAWYSIVSAENNIDQLTPMLMPDVAKLSAIGTWRYTKGVYQFHPELFSEIIKSIVKGPLPSDVLTRLPEWSLFIETPGMKWFGIEMDGFFVHLEFDINTQRTELRFLLATEDGLIPQILHIGNWTVTEAIDRAISEAARQGQPLISLVLYVCSDEPEIGIPGQKPPQNPQAKRTKKGWKIFPADHPRFFKTGSETGERLQYERRKPEVKGRPKPHIRKAHWHGVWKGSGENKQFKYNWLSPVFVNSGLIKGE